MFRWIRRRRMSKEGQRRVMLAVARAEEALVDTHVSNVFDMLDLVGDDLDVDHAIEIYAQRLSLSETLAATVANRVLAHIGGEIQPPPSPRPSFRGAFRDD